MLLQFSHSIYIALKIYLSHIGHDEELAFVLLDNIHEGIGIEYHNPRAFGGSCPCGSSFQPEQRACTENTMIPYPVYFQRECFGIDILSAWQL